MITQHKSDESFDFIPPGQSDDKRHLPDSVLSEREVCRRGSMYPAGDFSYMQSHGTGLFVYYLKNISRFYR